MLPTPKIKWFGSIILAGILLVLAFMGGNWGITYSASASVNVAPIIYSINPSAVRAGSPNTLLLINGANFGNLIDTRVRLTGTGVDILLVPSAISSDTISVLIPAYLLAAAKVYTLTVDKTSGGTMPITEVSNPVSFTVLHPFFYLPLIFK